MRSLGQPEIPQFFAVQNDAYVLKQILRHYLDVSLAHVHSANREQIEDRKV